MLVWIAILQWSYYSNIYLHWHGGLLMTSEDRLSEILKDFDSDKKYDELKNLTISEWHTEITVRAALLKNAESGNPMSEWGIKELLKHPIQSKQTQHLKEDDSGSTIDHFLFNHRYGFPDVPCVMDLSPETIWAFNEQLVKHLKFTHPEQFESLVELTNQDKTFDALADNILAIKLSSEGGEAKIKYQDGRELSITEAKELTSSVLNQLKAIFSVLGDSYHLMEGEQDNFYSTFIPAFFDFTASDEDMDKAYFHWRDEKRKLLAKNNKINKKNSNSEPVSIKKGFTEQNIKDWIKYETLQYLDIVLIAKCLSVDISHADIADALYLKEKSKRIRMDWVKRVRETTRPKAEQMINIDNIKFLGHRK